MRTNTCGLVSAACHLVLACGCHQQSQTVVDPFLGRTTVPPPGTGQAGQVLPPSPYDASAPSFVPPAPGAPGAVAPPASYAPQGTPPTYAPASPPVYQTPPVTGPPYQQSRWRSSTPLSAAESNPAETTAAAEASGVGETIDVDEPATAQSTADDGDETMARTADTQAPRARTASFRDPRGLDELGRGSIRRTQHGRAVGDVRFSRTLRPRRRVGGRVGRGSRRVVDRRRPCTRRSCTNRSH